GSRGPVSEAPECRKGPHPASGGGLRRRRRAHRPGRRDPGALNPAFRSRPRGWLSLQPAAFTIHRNPASRRVGSPKGFYMRTSAPPRVGWLAAGLAIGLLASAAFSAAQAEDLVPAGWAAGFAATAWDDAGLDLQGEAADSATPSVAATLRAPAVETFRDPGGSLYQVGQASWYGADFAGLPTASGETYDMHAHTVAPPRCPLGPIVRVENLENGRLALARVNDRGPFARGRILDCSQRIASSLGFTHQGCAAVRVTLLDSLPDAWTRFDGFRPPFSGA